MKLNLKTVDETEAFGRALGACLVPGDTVLLKGGLGAGKSVLVRAASRALGVEGPMPSPTFTLMQPYEGRERVCHFDLYRLSDAEEFYAAGLDEPLGRDICFIEWPMEDVEIPEPWIEISLEYGDCGGERQAQAAFRGLGEREDALRRMLAAWEEKEN